MKIVDANVLIYAFDADADRHQEAKAWLDGALSGGASVGFSWMVLLAFVRLTTKPGVFPRPVTPEVAMRQVSDWLASPSALVVLPTEKHASVLTELVNEIGTAGNLVNDAHLAALAIEHRGEVVSYDHDFARFPRIRWERPG